MLLHSQYRHRNDSNSSDSSRLQAQREGRWGIPLFFVLEESTDVIVAPRVRSGLKIDTEHRPTKLILCWKHASNLVPVFVSPTPLAKIGNRWLCIVVLMQKHFTGSKRVRPIPDTFVNTNAHQ